MTVWINQCLTFTVSLLVKLSEEEFDSKPFGTLNPLNNGGLIHIYKLLHVDHLRSTRTGSDRDYNKKLSEGNITKNLLPLEGKKTPFICIFEGQEP